MADLDCKDSVQSSTAQVPPLLRFPSHPIMPGMRKFDISTVCVQPYVVASPRRWIMHGALGKALSAILQRNWVMMPLRKLVGIKALYIQVFPDICPRHRLLVRVRARPQVDADKPTHARTNRYICRCWSGIPIPLI